MTHLWEVDHPYYCEAGNFYQRDMHNEFSSWDEFKTTTLFDGDRDMNLLVRWDWHRWTNDPDPFLRRDVPDELTLHFVLQRKAILCSVGITVTEADEPAVREWLEKCARTTAAIWEPIALGVSA